MTKEKLDKIAKRYAQDELKDNHGQVEDIVAAAFLNGIDFAEHHPHWISVEDELPKEKGWYLIYDSSMSHDVCMWYGDCWGNCYNITHWMPIPEAPKKGGEQ